VLDAAALSAAAESPPAPMPVSVPETQGRRLWRDGATFARRRLVPAALLCSLAANGFFVAHLVVRSGGQEAAQVALRMTQSQSAPTVPLVSAPSTTAAGTKGDLERKVVALILSAPPRRLPRDFVDSTTGLVKNNVQVVCTKKQQRQRSFLCAVRMASGAASKAIYVRYATDKNGHGAFRWYGYRRS
jgi:hypothetical protein